MNLRQCGKHPLKLPMLGTGCYAFGGGEYWGQQSQADVDAVVRCAIEHGANFFDTAEAFNRGASESSLGLALREIPRDRVLIGTKISPSNVGPEKLIEHCEASLRRLQTDYLDLYMVHWPITAHSIKHFASEPMPVPLVPEVFATLERLRQAGKIRHIGVSNFGVANLSEARATGVEIVFNELPYSLLTRAIEMEILPFCRTQGIGVLGYLPLMQGVLADTYSSLQDVPAWRRRTRHFDCQRTPQCRHGMPGAEPETAAALAGIRAIAQRRAMPLSELALKWALAGEGITSSICGSRTVEQFQINLRAASKPLEPGIVAELNRVTQPLLEKLGSSFDYYEHPANDRT